MRRREEYIVHCMNSSLPNGPTHLEGHDMKALANKIGAWRRYRNSLKELSRLTDRELADLGLNRYDIADVARRSAGF